MGPHWFATSKSDLNLCHVDIAWLIHWNQVVLSCNFLCTKLDGTEIDGNGCWNNIRVKHNELWLSSVQSSRRTSAGFLIAWYTSVAPDRLLLFDSLVGVFWLVPWDHFHPNFSVPAQNHHPRLVGVPYVDDCPKFVFCNFWGALSLLLHDIVACKGHWFSCWPWSDQLLNYSAFVLSSGQALWRSAKVICGINLVGFAITAATHTHKITDLFVS